MLWVLHPWVKGGWKSSNNMEPLMGKIMGKPLENMGKSTEWGFIARETL